MRKADYAALASIIAGRIEHYTETAKDFPDHSCSPKNRLSAVRSLAKEFADRANVDRVQFLKACGIEE